MEGDPRYLIPKPSALVFFPTSIRPEFPEEGVLNSFGYLFHHFLPTTLLEEHIERLFEYGIRYKYNEPFSREEDDRIRKNWRRFAKKHGLAYEDGMLYAGLRVTNEVEKFYRKQNDKLVRRGMWPRLCRKLENRSASQVQRRMLLIFDPHFVGKPDLIPYFEIVDAFARMGEGTSVLDIAMDLKVPVLRLLGAMSHSRQEWRRQGLNAENIIADPSLLDKYRMLPREFRRFYKAVLLRSRMDEISLRRMIFAGRAAWKQELKCRMADFSWVPLIPQFGKLNEKTLKKTWWSLMKKTVKAFFAELEANVVGEDLALVSDGAQWNAWAIALDQTMPHTPITLPALKIFCHVLSNCVSASYQVLHIMHINLQKLTSKLIKKGLISEQTYDIKNCQYYNSVSRRIAQWNKTLFNHIDFPLNIRDKLRIAERCFDDLIEIHGEGAQISKFPVTKSLLANNTIHAILELCDGAWCPPKILQKYVSDRALIGVFSKNRGEMRDEEREKRIFRQNVFDETDFSSRSSAILLSKQNLPGWCSAGRLSYLPEKTRHLNSKEGSGAAVTKPNGGGWNLTAGESISRDYDVEEEGNRSVAMPATLKKSGKGTKSKNVVEEPSIALVAPQREETADETIVAGHMLSQTLSVGENNILGLSPIKRSHGGLVPSEKEERKTRKMEKKKKKNEERMKHERQPLATSTQQSPKRRREPSPPPRNVSPVEEEEVEGDEEALNDDGNQFSHLLVTSSQPLSKRPRRSPPPSANNTMNSWLDLFS